MEPFISILLEDPNEPEDKSKAKKEKEENKGIEDIRLIPDNPATDTEQSTEDNAALIPDPDAPAPDQE
jgi:hypothetical protein